MDSINFDAKQRLIQAGLIPASAALDQGYNTLGDVLTQTANGRPLNDIWAEFNAALNMWNADRDALIAALTYNVGAPIEDVGQTAFGDFELASEFGVPKGITGAGYFSLGYTFKWYDLAARFTWQYLAEASDAQVESVQNQAFEADNRNIFKAIMAAVFRQNNRTANIQGQNYNVYALYNNDGTVPPPYANFTHTGTHTHYLTSGAATVDAGDLDEMETHIHHHGYGVNSGSTLVLMVNRQELQTIRTFRIATGAAYDYIPRQGNFPFLLPANTGGVSGGVPESIAGLPVEGQYGNWLVVVNDYIPAGYLFGFATGGRNSLSNPVGFREHANASLRGMRLVRGPIPDYPLIESYYQRGFGTGIRHRGAGVVMQIKVAAGYVNPPAYDIVA